MTENVPRLTPSLTQVGVGGSAEETLMSSDLVEEMKALANRSDKNPAGSSAAPNNNHLHLCD